MPDAACDHRHTSSPLATPCMDVVAGLVGPRSAKPQHSPSSRVMTPTRGLLIRRSQVRVLAGVPPSWCREQSQGLAGGRVTGGSLPRGQGGHSSTVSRQIAPFRPLSGWDTGGGSDSCKGRPSLIQRAVGIGTQGRLVGGVTHDREGVLCGHTLACKPSVECAAGGRPSKAATGRLTPGATHHRSVPFVSLDGRQELLHANNLVALRNLSGEGEGAKRLKA
jgi:hypothetical protein